MYHVLTGWGVAVSHAMDVKLDPFCSDRCVPAGDFHIYSSFLVYSCFF